MSVTNRKIEPGSVLMVLLLAFSARTHAQDAFGDAVEAAQAADRRYISIAFKRLPREDAYARTIRAYERAIRAFKGKSSAEQKCELASCLAAFAEHLAGARLPPFLEADRIKTRERERDRIASLVLRAEERAWQALNQIRASRRRGTKERSDVAWRVGSVLVRTAILRKDIGMSNDPFTGLEDSVNEIVEEDIDVLEDTVTPRRGAMVMLLLGEVYWRRARLRDDKELGADAVECTEVTLNLLATRLEDYGYDATDDAEHTDQLARALAQLLGFWGDDWMVASVLGSRDLAQLLRKYRPVLVALETAKQTRATLTARLAFAKAALRLDKRERKEFLSLEPLEETSRAIDDPLLTYETQNLLRRVRGNKGAGKKPR